MSNKSDRKCCLLPPFDRVGIILVEQLSRTWINLEECIMASHNAARPTAPRLSQR